MSCSSEGQTITKKHLDRATRIVNSVTETYAYDEADKLETVTVNSNVVKEFTYDAAGRTTAVETGSGTTSFAYDYEGRVTSITYPSTSSDSYGYNGLGARTSTSGTNGSRTFLRNGLGVTSPVLEDGNADYTPGVSRRASSATTFAHAGLKNTSAQSAENGTVAASRVYDAFGNVVSSSGTWSGPFGYAGRLGYHEDSNGYRLLGHRFYDPSIGRFITQDPIGSGNNWYSYADNSPTTNADPTGLVVVIFRKVLKGSTRFMRRLGGPIRKDSAMKLRQNGENVVVQGRDARAVDKAARDVEDSVPGKTIHHDPADDMAHDQTNGKKGHTFKRLLPGVSVPCADAGDQYHKSGGSNLVATLIDMVNPFEELDFWMDAILCIATPAIVGSPYQNWPEGLPMPGTIAFVRSGTPVYH